MSLLKEDVIALLKQIPFPGMQRDIVDYGAVLDVQLTGTTATIQIELLTKNAALPTELEQTIKNKLQAHGITPQIKMQIRSLSNLGTPPTKQVTAAGPHGTSPDPWADRQRLNTVRYVVAVSSGKGGVGKSTVAVNLALALKAHGLKVGLMDADIYGPSAPMMLGIADIEPKGDSERRLYPIEAYGLETISIGYLIHDEQPVIWRGPLVMKTIEQFLRGVAWNELDVLVVDLPPGTGDAQLSLVQKVPIDGAVIVTTPQDVALADVVRGHAMFEKVGVPVLGIVENMSYFICPTCQSRHEIFAHGGGRSAAQKRGLAFLAEIPLDQRIRETSDAGKPIVVSEPTSLLAQTYLDLAKKVWQHLTSAAHA